MNYIVVGLIILIILGIGGYFGYQKWFGTKDCSGTTTSNAATYVYNTDQKKCVANTCITGYNLQADFTCAPIGGGGGDAVKKGVAILLYGDGGTVSNPVGASYKNYMMMTYPQAIGLPASTYSPGIHFITGIVYVNGIQHDFDYVQGQPAKDAYNFIVDTLNDFNKLTGSDAFPHV